MLKNSQAKNTNEQQPFQPSKINLLTPSQFTYDQKITDTINFEHIVDKALVQKSNKNSKNIEKNHTIIQPEKVEKFPTLAKRLK